MYVYVLLPVERCHTTTGSTISRYSQRDAGLHTNALLYSMDQFFLCRPLLCRDIYLYIYIYILCHMVLNTAKRGGEHTQREREIDERRSPALDLRAGSFLGIPALFCGAAPYHRMISSFPFCCGWRCAVSLVHRGGVCINIYGCCVGWCAAHTHKPKRQPLFFSFPPVWCVPSFLPTPTLTMHMSLYCAPLILFGAPLLPAYDIQGAA